MSDPQKAVKEKRDTSSAPEAAKVLDPDLRFRYIGFEVHSPKIKNFWKSAEEEKQYLEKIRREGSVWLKARSLVNVAIFSAADRALVTAISLVVLGSLFLPWASGAQRLWALPLFGELATHLSQAAGPVLLAAAVLGLALVATVPVVALANLVSVWRRGPTEEKYAFRLRRVLLGNWLPIILWLLLLVGALVGAPLSAGAGAWVQAARFDFMAVMRTIGLGLWVALGGHLVLAMKANEL